MPEIKERNKEKRLRKSRRPMLTPKQGAKLLREKYRKQFQQKQEQEKENENTDAAEQIVQATAHTAGWLWTSAVPNRTKAREVKADRKKKCGFVEPEISPLQRTDNATQKTEEWTESQNLCAGIAKSPKSDFTCDKLKPKEETNPPVEWVHTVIHQKSEKPAFRTKERVPHRTRDTAAQTAQRKAQRAVKSARHTAEQRMKGQAVTQVAKKTATPATVIMQRVKKAVSRAVTSMVQEFAILFGVGALLSVLVVVVVIGAVTSSPFGLLFADENKTSDTFTVSEAIAQINADYRETIRSWKSGFDRTYMSGQPADWTEVLAVFAVRYAGTEDGTDVTQMDADRISKLSAVFWDMTEIQTEIERIDHADSDPNDGINDSWTEYILYLDVIPKTADEMREIYGFTDYQNSALDELLNNPELLEMLICGRDEICHILRRILTFRIFV